VVLVGYLILTRILILAVAPSGSDQVAVIIVVVAKRIVRIAVTWRWGSIVVQIQTVAGRDTIAAVVTHVRSWSPSHI